MNIVNEYIEYGHFPGNSYQQMDEIDKRYNVIQETFKEVRDNKGYLKGFSFSHQVEDIIHK